MDRRSFLSAVLAATLPVSAGETELPLRGFYVYNYTLDKWMESVPPNQLAFGNVLRIVDTVEGIDITVLVSRVGPTRCWFTHEIDKLTNEWRVV